MDSPKKIPTHAEAVEEEPLVEPEKKKSTGAKPKKISVAANSGSNVADGQRKKHGRPSTSLTPEQIEQKRKFEEWKTERLETVKYEEYINPKNVCIFYGIGSSDYEIPVQPQRFEGPMTVLGQRLDALDAWAEGYYDGSKH